MREFASTDQWCSYLQNKKVTSIPSIEFDLMVAPTNAASVRFYRLSKHLSSEVFEV